MFDDIFANESNNFTSLALLIFPATSELAPACRNGDDARDPARRRSAESELLR
jgi:hypothetical protein